MRKSVFAIIAIAVVIFSGCTKQPRYIGGSDGQLKTSVTMGLDRGDFEKAAVEATESMLQSGALNKKGGGRYVVAIDQIINDTTQRIDTDMLIKKIRIAILRSGKAVTTTAIKVGGPESTLTRSVRDLREDGEVKRKTVAKKNSIIAPDMGLSGKIIQRNARASKSTQIVEYYFQLTLTHLESGLGIWEDEVVIGKMGSNDTVTW